MTKLTRLRTGYRIHKTWVRIFSNAVLTSARSYEQGLLSKEQLDENVAFFNRLAIIHQHDAKKTMEHYLRLGGKLDES